MHRQSDRQCVGYSLFAVVGKPHGRAMTKGMPELLAPLGLLLGQRGTESIELRPFRTKLMLAEQNCNSGMQRDTPQHTEQKPARVP